MLHELKSKADQGFLYVKKDLMFVALLQAAIAPGKIRPQQTSHVLTLKLYLMVESFLTRRKRVYKYPLTSQAPTMGSASVFLTAEFRVHLLLTKCGKLKRLSFKTHWRSRLYKIRLGTSSFSANFQINKMFHFRIFYIKVQHKSYFFTLIKYFKYGNKTFA